MKVNKQTFAEIIAVFIIGSSWLGGQLNANEPKYKTKNK